MARSGYAGPATVTLQNNTLPGHQTVHEIRRQSTRTLNRGKSVEALTTAHESTLVECNIALPQQGKILAYQMAADEPGKVLELKRDGKKISPVPPEAQFNLGKGSTRLASEHKTARESPVTFPPGDAAVGVIVSGLLDFCYWQPKKIEAGHKWQRRIDSALFDGTQTLQFVDMVDVDGQAMARLALKLEGKFKGPLEREYAFGMAEAIIHWARLERTIARVEGVAQYQRRRRDVVERFEIKLDERLRHVSVLTDTQQEDVKAQMSAFATAIQASNEGRATDARGACMEFRKAWPNSAFMPAILELQGRVAPDAASQDRMNRAQLQAAIQRSFVAYEAARSAHDLDLLDFTARTMGDLARDYAGVLAKHCRDKDETIRGNAAFALAFSRRPEDVKTAQKCALDKSAKVQVMALTGLAAAENPAVSGEMLLGLLDDKDVGVRRRTLQAVAACVQREDFAVAKLVEKIDRFMVHDKNDGVRSDAVSAMSAIGARADVPRLEEALHHELNGAIREQIHQAIEGLRGR